MEKLPIVLNKLSLPTLATALMVSAGSVYAEDADIAAGATGAISASEGTLKTVGIAIVTVVAAIWVIKRVIAMIR